MYFYKAIILALLFSIPFVPIQLDPIINYLIHFLAIILLPIFLPQLKKDLQSKNLITIFFIVFLLSSLISTFFSINPGISLRIFFLYLSYFVIFTASKKIFSERSDQKLLVSLLILATLFLSLISFYNTVFLNYVNKDLIGSSFMWLYYGHNTLANLLLYIIPLSVYFLHLTWENSVKRYLLSLITVFLLISFYLTFARGAYLALIFSLIITILLFIDFSKSNVRLSLVIFLWLLMISFFSINLIASNLNLHKSANLISGRDIYWQEALKNFQTKPLTGTGLNTYKIVSFKQTKKGILKTDSAHNFFLQMLSDGGILLFLSSIGLVVSLIISIFKKIKQVCRFAIKEQKKDYFLLSLWVGFVSSILYNLVDIGWQLPFCFLIFWIISAILIQDENHLKQS